MSATLIMTIIVLGGISAAFSGNGPIITQASYALAPSGENSNKDLGEQVNAAFRECANACTVNIPKGQYAFSTTIRFPVVSNGTAALKLDPGAVLTYTGSGYAIDVTGSGGPSQANVVIEGGRILGTRSGLAGIHLKAFNGATIRNIQISEFSGGAGIWNEGANTINIVFSVLSNNQDGLRNVGTVQNGSCYAANAVRVFGGYLIGNTRYGVFEDGSRSSEKGAGCTVGPNIGNYFSTTFEQNGTNDDAKTGQVFVQYCETCVFDSSYFEYTAGSSRGQSILIGDGTYKPDGVEVVHSIFASAGAKSTINNSSGQHTLIVGNNEVAKVTNFLNNGSSARLLTVLHNRAVAAANYLSGQDDGADSLIEGGPSPFTNAVTPTSTGMGFNSLTGLKQDLVIRTRKEGTNVVVFQSMDASRLGAISNRGLATLKGFVATSEAPAVEKGQIGYGSKTTRSVGTAGGASALPATPAGYIIVNIEGKNYKVPFYN